MNHLVPRRVKAALLDLARNVEAALITSVTGLAVVGPLPIAAYRGWVGERAAPPWRVLEPSVREAVGGASPALQCV
jgi:hypothetical protein